MSIWTEIEGTVKIRKKDGVSIREVIRNTFTDEFSIDVKTTDDNDCYSHELACSICMDGTDFMDSYKEFLKNLKPVHCDLTCSVRILM